MASKLHALLVAAGLAAGLAAPAFADNHVNTTFLGNAVEGYDVVAYHLDGKPVEGSGDFEHEWEGATWRFASAEHRDLFAADPAKYAPAYGGYCAYGVSLGHKPNIDPEAWRIVDGTLYLNLNPGIQARWEKDIPGFIAKANDIWPTIAHN
ncbi:MAG: YHS domain-containing (seleno)protein [Alphaproteobacteria bacterium]|jgi:YHS domain-containing protein|nr:YHS domain-containing (seleno)protein [Alphaproteobacteria bacterium]